MYAAFNCEEQDAGADSSFVTHSEDLNCIRKLKSFMNINMKPSFSKQYFWGINTDQLFAALLWQPHGVILMKMYDGLMNRSRELGGRKLFIVLQQTQTEREWLSLRVQHI